MGRSVRNLRSLEIMISDLTPAQQEAVDLSCNTWQCDCDHCL